MNNTTVSLPDGRRLGYCIVGQGKPVIYFHGTASSRLEALLLRELAVNANLQIICIDRPGYGLSTFQPRKNLQAFNGDVNFLAQHLGIQQFSVLGWSGGGVFALAYLAFHPAKVKKAIVVSTPNLPFDASTAHNFPFARFIMKLPYVGVFAMRELRREVLKANGDVIAFLKSSQGKRMLHGCSGGDLKFYSNPHWMELMYQSMVEAFRQGNVGVKAVVEEHQIFMKPWSIPFAGIAAGQLHIWHGMEDKTCRVSNAYAISRTVPSAKLDVFPGSGHCVIFENLERLVEILRS